MSSFQPDDLVRLAATATKPALVHRVITCRIVHGAVAVEIVHGICVEEGAYKGKHDYRCSAEATRVTEIPTVAPVLAEAGQLTFF